MEIDLEKLAQLAKAFYQPNPKYAALADAFRRLNARTLEQRRLDDEHLLVCCSKVELAGGQYAKAAGQVRRGLAAKLLTDAITGTSH